MIRTNALTVSILTVLVVPLGLSAHGAHANVRYPASSPPRTAPPPPPEGERDFDSDTLVEVGTGGGDVDGGKTTDYDAGTVTEITDVAVVSESSPGGLEAAMTDATARAARPHLAFAERDPYDPTFCEFGNGVFNPVPGLTEGPMLTANEIRAFGLDLTSTYRHVTYTCYGTERDMEYPAIIRVTTGPGIDRLLTQVTGTVITSVNPPDVTLSPPDRGVVNLPTWLRRELVTDRSHDNDRFGHDPGARNPGRRGVEDGRRRP